MASGKKREEEGEMSQLGNRRRRKVYKFKCFGFEVALIVRNAKNFQTPKQLPFSHSIHTNITL